MHVLHDDGAVAVLGKGLAVRALEVVRELFSLSSAFSAPGPLDIFLSPRVDARCASAFFSSLARAGLCYVFSDVSMHSAQCRPTVGTDAVNGYKIYLAEGVTNIYRVRHRQCRLDEELRCVQIA